MADTLTPKQEQFSQEYVNNGGNASEAYRASYNSANMKTETIHRKAHDVFIDGKVSARIKEIQQEANKKYEVSRDYLNETLQYVLNQSRLGEIPNLDLTRKAAMDLAKLNGLIIDIGKLDVNAVVTQMATIKKEGKEAEFNL